MTDYYMPLKSDDTDADAQQSQQQHAVPVEFTGLAKGASQTRALAAAAAMAKVAEQVGYHISSQP